MVFAKVIITDENKNKNKNKNKNGVNIVTLNIINIGHYV